MLEDVYILYVRGKKHDILGYIGNSLLIVSYSASYIIHNEE